MILSVAGLRKVYGNTVAVEGVSFAVQPGEIVGLLGPNGAGKTTIINAILAVLEPTEGHVKVAGHDVWRARTKALQQTNFAAVYAPLPGNLTVEQNLYIFGMLYSVRNLRDRCDTLIHELDLERFRKVKCGLLSSGEQTRVALAKAMLNTPRLLLLDEPTASLDPATAQDIRAHIRRFVEGQDRGVLWTSHNMHEVTEVCHRVLLLAHGRILLEGDPGRSRREARSGRSRSPLHFGRAPMSFTRVGAIMIRQWFLIRGSVSRVIPLFAWVAIDMVLWGFITRYLNTFSPPGFSFVPTLLGAVLLWDFFARVMQGVTTAFFEDVWSRNFLNVFGSPITVAEYVMGLVLTSILSSAIGLTVMLLLASAVFGLSFLSFGLVIVPFLLVLFLFGIALGIVGCSIVMRWGPSSEWFIWPIPALLEPFTCVMYPLHTLPGWMQAIARVLPPSYVFESMRALLQRAPVSMENLGISVGLAVLDIVLASMLFRTVYRHALRTGLIARYSAESVS